MEVHHHSSPAQGGTHTPGKKWTHYFWEFIMLFLAVTLGFFVENQRDHFIENQRAKELARALYSELLDDSVAIANKIQLRLRRRIILIT